MSVSAEEWSLRRASSEDVERLHALMGVPEVYRYLTDGVAMSRESVEEWVANAQANEAAHGYGLWLLEGHTGMLSGGVELKTWTLPHAAELSYLLHPKAWGHGLATRMSWTVIQRAFAAGYIDRVVAGADAPNTASVRVMNRLGMTFLQHVTYPLGPGVEYVLWRDDPAPSPLPTLIPLRD